MKRFGIAVLSAVFAFSCLSASAGITNSLKKVYKNQFSDQVRDVLNDNVDKVGSYFNAVSNEMAASTAAAVGVTTNVLVLVPTGTNTFCFTNGVLRTVK